MVSFNTIILGGHLGAEPEERRLPSGKLLCTFSLATNRWDKRTEEETTDWHTVIAWEKQAEVCLKYLRKGSPVLIEGRLQMRTWDGADGKKNSKAEINAQRVVFLGASRAAAEAAPEAAKAAKEAGRKEPAYAGGFNVDAVPF